MTAYRWYEVVARDGLQQGDIFERIPVFSVEASTVEAAADVAANWEEVDAVVMTQSCDLAPGREKVSHVVLCALWDCAKLTTGHLSTPKGREDLRRGNLPAFHLLNKCDESRFERGYRVVDFRKLYSIPLVAARSHGDRPHCRLKPPYREHLSQAFARYFMRVGLPVDIPAFL